MSNLLESGLQLMRAKSTCHMCRRYRSFRTEPSVYDELFIIGRGFVAGERFRGIWTRIHVVGHDYVLSHVWELKEKAVLCHVQQFIRWPGERHHEVIPSHNFLRPIVGPVIASDLDRNNTSGARHRSQVVCGMPRMLIQRWPIGCMAGNDKWTRGNRVLEGHERRWDVESPH